MTEEASIALATFGEEGANAVAKLLTDELWRDASKAAMCGHSTSFHVFDTEHLMHF